jgi:iron complex outermembrane receptor protein
MPGERSLTDFLAELFLKLITITGALCAKKMKKEVKMIQPYSKKTQHALLAVLLAVLLGTTAMTASFATQALAQDDEEEFLLQDIVVTGSRIVRNNMDSTSPIVTVDEDLFDQSSTLAIETQLNKLPQFTPTIDIPTSGGDIQPTARNTPGEATVALRGLGANRSLVLVNGRRGTPANGMGVLDINTIPIAAIEYVEAISGGASAVYGADAMAGVVNFIMKDDFVGLEIDAQSGITQEGDNFEYQISGVWGADVADGRGNVMMALSYNDRGDALQGDRDWYRESWADPSKAGTQFWAPYTAIGFGFSNLPDANVLNDVMGLTEGEGYTNPVLNVTVYDDFKGNAFTGFGMACTPVSRTGVPAAIDAGIVDNYAAIVQNNGCLGYNNIKNYLIFPMQRYNMYTQGNFEITDWIGVFGQAYFSTVDTHTIQEPGVITTSGENVPIYPEYNREALPDELLAILDSRPDRNAPFGLQWTLPANRETLSSTQTSNLTGGLEGTIPGTGWTWEAFYSYGKTSTFTQGLGYASLERTRIVVGGVIDYTDDGSPIFYDGYHNFGQGFIMTGNEEGGGVGGATATCTSGFNPFVDSGITEDCWDAIKADIKTHMIMEQTVWEANTQGPIADLPAGELRGALGTSHRKNVFNFISETINSEGVSFHDQILGLNPAQDSFGKIGVWEVYAELLVPVLSDLPGIKQLNLELGGRRSDYSTTGTSETYKILADWQATDWLRFRGGYNRAERAPNIAELFLNPEMTFAAYSGGDPCSTLNVNSYSANPDLNPDYYDVITLCGETMERTGNPDADYEYYGDDYRVIREDPSLATNQPTATFGFIWPEIVGNDALKPEIADTWTVGVVIDSPLDDPWLSDLRISIDYYSIEIEDAIGQQSGGMVMRQCLDPTFNPTYDVNSSFCDGMPRDFRNGGVGQLRTSFYNNGAFETSGIDLNINWGKDAGPGRLSVTSNVNYLIDKKSTELATVDPMIDYAGTFGPNQNGLNGNSYEWRALTQMSYYWGDLNFSLRWDFKSHIEQAVVAQGLPGSSGGSSYHLFDLLGNYALTDNVWLRFGVENVFDKEPPVIGVNPDDPNGMYGGTFNAQNYDTNGRRFYLGARVNFD